MDKLIAIFKRWLIKRRLLRVCKRIIRESYRHTFFQDGVSGDRLVKALPVSRIATNGYDNGGAIYAHPFLIIFDYSTIGIALVEDPDGFHHYYHFQKLAEAWGTYAKPAVLQNPHLTLIEDEEGDWWDELDSLTERLEDDLEHLIRKEKTREKKQAQSLFHKLKSMGKR